VSAAHDKNLIAGTDMSNQTQKVQKVSDIIQVMKSGTDFTATRPMTLSSLLVP